MPAKDTGTEQLIKATAKRIFFAEGKLHATTQDIANAAGVNRAALHYYFRTRDQLVAVVFNESMRELSERLGTVMASDQSFKEKVRELIAVFMKEMTAYPYQETFLVTEINTSGMDLVKGINEVPVNAFLDEVETEMNTGNIEKMPPRHFLMNLFSLLSYPVIMSPIYRQFFKMSQEDFAQLLAEREQLIYQHIFK
ncbi:TetR/AcrR family transcriptional regulator [Mucilaginibacter rigui]|uniref:TetR/AcrR family transcriptional regulator n=1 Tax=Mucilaginibacter rigui TaxID=534635 RepID=A0ABR7X7W0_9SPHI|nr:TetR/AcrR family transcriptional regulator [Mucilaginibacter rigui]MBD1386678.1 TetR/AcrR family transcriptional regulator [Mucilaginibacter rigui]